MIASPVLDLYGLMNHFDEYWTAEAGRDLVEYVVLRRLYELGKYSIRYQYISRRIENLIFYSPNKTFPMLELYFDVNTYEVVAYRYTYMAGGVAHYDFSPINNTYLPFVANIVKLDNLFVDAMKQRNRCILLLLVAVVLMILDRYLWPYFMSGALFFFAYMLVQRLRMVYIRSHL